MTKASKDAPSFRITPVVLHVLISLAEDDAHAYGIMKEVEARTDGRLTPGPGSLHFTLVKLTSAGLITETPAPSAPQSDSRRKYYRITELGRATLQRELGHLADLVEFAKGRDLLADGPG